VERPPVRFNASEPRAFAAPDHPHSAAMEHRIAADLPPALRQLGSEIEIPFIFPQPGQLIEGVQEPAAGPEEGGLVDLAVARRSGIGIAVLEECGLPAG